MALSWNEIRSRAVAFSKEWQGESSEDAEAKSFLDGFFNVFGINRRRVAIFEQAVKKSKGKQGYIDLFWKSQLIVEHKSRGKDLDRAYKQALEYCEGLTETELPKYILVSDFDHFHLHDLEENKKHEFRLKDLVDHVHLFGFIAGYEKKSYKSEDPVNILAAERMGKLHDALKDVGYTGHALEVYLVRLLFCLFADDTSIFEKGTFAEYIDVKTREDGSDLALHLDALFTVLNTPTERRLRNLDEHLKAFPYVNGRLFEERLPNAGFDAKMRLMLLQACALDWSRISPAIFGSMFQSVMDEQSRRNLGAHYTSERNILKLIKPLFLDDLHRELKDAGGNKRKLQQLQQKVSTFRMLDPACGCGNFLVIAYRELRLLEIDIVKELLKGQQVLDIGHYFLVNVDQFFGIEIEEFPAQIAQVAMWLTDHQMNLLASEQFGEYFVRLPLKKSPTIVNRNSLQVEWESLLPTGDRYTHILGNPPFLGKSLQSKQQKEDMERVFMGVNGAGVLDFVAAWYIKAAQYLKVNDTVANEIDKTKVAFVSTNSISQGEQVSVLWGELFNKYHIKIHFAHRTFKWGNEARGNAAVHVVIVGFSNFDISNKQLFEYDDIKGEPHVRMVTNINPYLVAGKDNFVTRAKKPISNVPEMIKGNQPTDDGNYLFTTAEKNAFIIHEPRAEKFFRRFIGSFEFINNIERWCLWLKDADPREVRQIPSILERIENVRAYRLKSTKAATVKKAETPMLFDEIRHTGKDYLVVPEVSSERRKYMPVGYMDGLVISSNKNYMLPEANLYLFGILNSLMHNVWIKNVTGRLKSDIQYSNGIVYNNYPFPLSIELKYRVTVEKAAQAILDVRATFPDSSLADLYDPNTMPPALMKAHQALDKAVDVCYRSKPFTSEAERMEFLFDLYDQYTNELFASATQAKKKTKTKA